jgi:putative transposase
LQGQNQLPKVVNGIKFKDGIEAVAEIKSAAWFTPSPTFPHSSSIVTDGLRAYSAAMNKIGVAAERHEVGGRLNNRAENSHQPFRRRERAMQRFRSPKTLQKFSSVHAQVHNQFNQERHLVTRQVYKQRRSAALAEWRALAA